MLERLFLLEAEALAAEYNPCRCIMMSYRISLHQPSNSWLTRDISEVWRVAYSCGDEGN